MHGTVDAPGNDGECASPLGLLGGPACAGGIPAATGRTHMKQRSKILLGALTLVLGCGDDDPGSPSDAAAPGDASLSDAAAGNDAGGLDGSTADASTPSDAAAADSGS